MGEQAAGDKARGEKEHAKYVFTVKRQERQGRMPAAPERRSYGGAEAGGAEAQKKAPKAL
jgi:hypothetical protein